MCRSEKIEETVGSKTRKLKPRSLDSENVEKVKQLRYEKERRILEADWTQSVKMGELHAVVPLALRRT